MKCPANLKLNFARQVLIAQKAARVGMEPIAWLYKLIDSKAEPEPFTTRQAAVFLGVSIYSIRRYVHRGFFPSVRSLTARTIRIPYGELVSFADKRRIFPTSAEIGDI